MGFLKSSFVTAVKHAPCASNNLHLHALEALQGLKIYIEINEHFRNPYNKVMMIKMLFVFEGL